VRLRLLAVRGGVSCADTVPDSTPALLSADELVTVMLDGEVVHRGRAERTRSSGPASRAGRAAVGPRGTMSSGESCRPSPDAAEVVVTATGSGRRHGDRRGGGTAGERRSPRAGRGEAHCPRQRPDLHTATRARAAARKYSVRRRHSARAGGLCRALARRWSHRARRCHTPREPCPLRRVARRSPGPCAGAARPSLTHGGGRQIPFCWHRVMVGREGAGERGRARPP